MKNDVRKRLRYVKIFYLIPIDPGLYTFRLQFKQSEGRVMNSKFNQTLEYWRNVSDSSVCRSNADVQIKEDGEMTSNRWHPN